MAQIQFKGKSFVQNHHLLVKYHELIPKKDKSLTDKVSLHDNLIIHGDNLIALKALLPIYAGKIKCIYIDPPYNTGNEKWVYNDNVNSPIGIDPDRTMPYRAGGSIKSIRISFLPLLLPMTSTTTNRFMWWKPKASI